ncbi:MAG: class I SAM-dependent methyltransferase [Acidimicrobiia bacterium]
MTAENTTAQAAGSTDSERKAGLIPELYKHVVQQDSQLFGPSYFGEFLNWGYWKADTETQIEACENLVDLVLSLVPQLSGQVLDVACGLGGGAKRLARRLPPANITGINIMKDQLEVCAKRVPEARFLEMSATSMEFSDSSFDCVLCVEAAMHFDTRERFLAEALRVLKPGGYLSLADIIGFPVNGANNYAASPDEYGAMLRRAGFVEVRVLDVTADVSWAHADRAVAYLQQLLEEQSIGRDTYDELAMGRLARVTAGRFYVVAGARKPIPGKPRWRRLTSDPMANYLRSVLVRTAGR